jgi:protein-tyrosine-phosphatase
MLHILFVCTGNTCRSPMAEAIFGHWIEENKLPIQVQSAGIAATHGVDPSPNTYQVLEQRGMKVRSSSQPVHLETIHWADLILTMTTHHKKVLLEHFPEAIDKVYTLKEYVNDVADTQQMVQRLDELYSEMELKQSLFVSKHRDELNALERKHRSLDTELVEVEDELENWRGRLARELQEERVEIENIERNLPNFDIHDPFGGPKEMYEICATDLEAELKKLLEKVKSRLSN